MSEEYDVSQFRKRTLVDYLELATRSLYLLGAILFVGGLWIDWQNPGQVVINFLVFTDEPYENSGLFIGAILLLFVGFLISRVADYLERRSYEEIEDQTQEWVVDVGADR